MIVLEYFNAFWVGGLICVVAQILVDKTKLTPARILTSFVVAGVVLGSFGIYEKLVDFALSLGVKNAYIQDSESSGMAYIPNFDFEGIAKVRCVCRLLQRRHVVVPMYVFLFP